MDVAESGQMFLSASVDHTVRLWDLRMDVAIRIYKAGNADVNNVAYFPDGQAFGNVN